jgi:hypothetical protein
MSLVEMLEWLDGHTFVILENGQPDGEWTMSYLTGDGWKSESGGSPFEVCDAVVRKLARR